jgi:DNA-binding CsgD family transcriptional regulator
MKAFNRLIARLGARQTPATHIFELDQELVSAVVNLAEQEQRPAPEVAAELVKTGLAQWHTRGALYQRWRALTPREQEVTALACLGYTNRQMAGRMGISPETVKTHLCNALVKFDMHGKAEIRKALETWDFSEWGEKEAREGEREL